MRYASVCDGIGAVHAAWQPLGWECAWTSEIEPFPAAVVDHHWKLKNLGDMTKLTEEMLDECGPISLLCGGTPCQSFSVAGLRKGLEDPRGNLALRFTQLVGVLRPEWVVWENVPGVLSSGNGRDFGTFLGALAELGYGFAYRILDAQWFGVAQRRRRVFVVANAGDWRRAAAVLFERESLFGNPPTRGAKGQDSASGFADGLGGGLAKPLGSHALSKGRGTDLDNTTYVADPQAIAFGGQMSTPQVDVELSQTLQRKNPQAVAVDTYNQAIGDVSIPLRVGNAKDSLPAAMVPFTKSKRAQSTTDDESWVPGEVAPTQSCFDQGDTRATTVVAFAAPIQYAEQLGREKRQNGMGLGDDGDPMFTLETRQPHGVACEIADTLSVGANQTTGFVGDAVASCEVSSSLRSNPGSGWRSNGTPVEGVAIQGMAVRRLTPRECERLQGFPDDYTAVTYRKKPSADGPRYKALGNSMAVPVMAWIGKRIAEVEATDGT